MKKRPTIRVSSGLDRARPASSSPDLSSSDTSSQATQSYGVVTGSIIPRGKAQEYGERLRFLWEHHHSLAEDVVIADAQNPRSPLHSYFEWDDAEAARAHRRNQATYLVRSVGPIIVREDGSQTVIPGFWKIRTEAGTEIVPVDVIAKRPSEYNAILLAKAARLTAEQRTLSDLAAYFSGPRKRSITRAAEHITKAAALVQSASSEQVAS